MAVDVGVHHVLSGRTPEGQCFTELLPILSGVEVEERVGERVVERPAQGEFASLVWNEVGDDGAVPRNSNIKSHIGRALHMDDFAAMLWIAPALWRFILAGEIEIFNKEVFDRGFDVGKSPGNALVVPDNDEGHAGKCDAGYVERAALEMGFVPEVRHLVAEVHIVGEQGLSGDGVRAGDDPVVGAG